MPKHPREFWRDVPFAAEAGLAILRYSASSSAVFMPLPLSCTKMGASVRISGRVVRLKFSRIFLKIAGCRPPWDYVPSRPV